MDGQGTTLTGRRYSRYGAGGGYTREGLSRRAAWAINHSKQSTWSQVCATACYLGDSVAVLQVGGFRETLRLVNTIFPAIFFSF